MKNTFLIFKKTFQEWKKDEATTLAAALAYYSVFSLAPALLLIIFFTGLFLRDQMIQEQILNFFQANVGSDAAQTVESMLGAFANKQKGSLFIQIIGFLTLALGATGVVNQLQFAFNKIWNVELKPQVGFKIALKKRLFSFLLIGAIGLLILISLLVSTGLALALNYIRELLPIAAHILPLSDFFISLAVLSLLFLIMFRYLPDVKLSWKCVWRGAVLTSLLFLLGKFGLSWYFSAANVGSTYGLAGSFILLLLWVYYSSLILLFGVEFTQVWAREKGFIIEPKKEAQYQDETLVIKTPGVTQKIVTVLKVLKTQWKIVSFFLGVKRRLKDKKSKK